MSDQTTDATDHNSGRPFAIISADSHVGLPAEEYVQYLD